MRDTILPSPSRSASTAAVAALALSVSVLLSASAATAAQPQPGKPAPAFEGIDSKGVEHTLAKHAGKVVVLEWTNHECPYTVKHYVTGNMQAQQREATGSGVVWLSVVSSSPGSQGHVSAGEADALTAARKASPTAVLLDPTGKIGRAYGARTTPHMFVIGKDGRLAYMGAIDDKPSANRADVAKAKPYVKEALAAVMAGAPVQVASTRPYGCSVKY